jgi:hypothetical protein
MRRDATVAALGAWFALLAACGPDEPPAPGRAPSAARPGGPSYDLEGRALVPFARPTGLPDVAVVLLDAAPAGSPADGALRELAAAGLSFPGAASASPDAWPSLASVLTSLLPGTHGVGADGVVPSGYARMWTTGAEVFARTLGYRTVALVPKGFSPHAEPLLQGFATVLRGDDAPAALAAWAAKERLAAAPGLFLCVLPADAVTPAALPALHEALAGLGGGRPLLLAATALRGAVLAPTAPVAEALSGAALRVPLAWVGPAVPRGVRAGTLGLTDLFPTLLALAGAPPLDAVAGASFAPLLETDGPSRPSAFEWQGAPRRRVIGVHAGELVYGVVHDVDAGTVLEHLLERGRDLSDAEGRLPERTFDAAFADAVERARDRVWAGVRETNHLSAGGYDANAALVTAERPPPLRTHAP